MYELVEVFSVTYKGGGGAAPSGTVSVFDGKRGQIIYRRRRGRGQTLKPSGSHLPSNGNNDAVELPLTGPYRAISADGCVAVELDLHHHCKDRAPYVAQILLDVYDPSTEYDVPLTKAVRTCACRDSPSAEVTYALLSDAAEAAVEVRLLGGRRDDRPVRGRIVARGDLGEVVLFESADDEEESTRAGSSTGSVPLARSVLAVPLTSSLKIDVELRRPSTGELIVEGSVVCRPGLDGEQRLGGMDGEVEVKITWSD